MQIRLPNILQKDEKKLGSLWCFVKRMKGNYQRGRGREFLLFTLVSVIVFSVVLWSTEPRLTTLLSVQEQFSFPSPVIKREDHPVQTPNLVQAKIEQDKPKPLTDNVEEPKHLVKESSTWEGPSITQGSSTTQEPSMIDGFSSTDQHSVTEGSLTIKTEDKEGKNMPFAPEKEELEDKPKPLTDNVQNTKLTVEESFASKGSFTTQEPSLMEEPSVARGSSTTEGYLAREKEDKDSTSTLKEKDIAKSKDHYVQEPPLAYTQTEDNSKSLIDNVENTKSVVKESLASEGSFATQDSLAMKGPSAVEVSSPIKGSLGTEKENKDLASTSEKKDPSIAEPMAKESPKLDGSSTTPDSNATKSPTATNGSSSIKGPLPIGNDTTQGSGATEKPTATKDSSSTKGPLPISKDATQGFNVTEEPTATKGSSSTKRPLPIGKDSTPTSKKKVCNYAKGQWIFDNKRPLYSGTKCKRWLSWMWACRLTTRPDFRFEQYRWQPENCDMPEFERTTALKRLQNKTIAFVGDSIGRQQFQSLMCMLTGGEDMPDVLNVSDEFKLTSPYGLTPLRNGAFRFTQTNTTILYYWSSSLCDLVPLNTSDPETNVAMHLDRPPLFIKQFLDRFDVLVLNTGAHWNRGKFKVNRWVMHVDGKPVKDKDLLFKIGYAKNLTIFNIVRWLDSQLPSHPRLKVFFTLMSPRHFFNGEWNTGGSCENLTPLVHGTEVKQDESSDQLAANAVSGTKVNLLDITALSELRDEGHMSKYGHKADSGIRDCLHWCLPGIPDTWNEILVAQI